MKAREIMQKPVLTASSQTSIQAVALQLLDHAISGMPITTEDGTVVGLLTEADILWALYEGKQLSRVPVEDYMYDNPITVDVEDSAEHVLKCLVEERIVRVPVTEAGKLVGIISRSDVIRCCLEAELKTA
jgi:tRNA nucleotidyltransferase (CCA-adding enzyme)